MRYDRKNYQDISLASIYVADLAGVMSRTARAAAPETAPP
jgi:hypothetical protein